MTTEIKSSAFGASIATITTIKAAEENTQAARKGGVTALVALINDQNPLWGIDVPQDTTIQHGAAVSLANILKKGGVAQSASKRLSEQTVQAVKHLLTLEPANRLPVFLKAADSAKSTAGLMADLGGRESAKAKKAEKDAEKEEGIAASLAADKEREAIARGIFAWGILIAPIASVCAWGQENIILPRLKAAEEEKAAAAAQAAAQAAADAQAAAAAQAATAAAALQAAEDDFKAVEAALKAAPNSRALKAAYDAARQAVEASRLAAACPETAAAAAAAAADAEAASKTLEKAAELIPDSLPRLKAAAKGKTTRKTKGA